MAQNRRVSFVPAGVKWREGKKDGDGLVVGARPQQSIFARLGPKVSVRGGCDPPYVPEAVGEPPLPGMIFGCSPETYDECIGRQLFGLPVWKHKAQVMRIAPGAAIFLFNFITKRMLGIFEATSHGGVHIIREAFGGQFEAQVKVRLVEDCPPLHEADFKDAIRENYTSGFKFNFPLSDTQVCRLKLLFRLKAAEVSALSIDLNHGRRVVQFCPSAPQQARNSVQVQRRSYINSFSKDANGVGMPTAIVSVPPVLSRVHVSPAHTRSRSLGGLEVSICSIEKKDKQHNGVFDSPKRHVVMYDTRKEQSIVPVFKSKFAKPARHEAVKEVLQSRSSRGISQDRKRRADTSPHRVQECSKQQCLLEEQGQQADKCGSGKQYGDLRELLTEKVKKLKPSTKEMLKSVVKPMDSPVYTGGSIAIGDVLFIDDSKRNLERVLPLPRTHDSTTTSGSPKAESSKGLLISRASKEAQSPEARKYENIIRPVQGVQRKLKIATVPAYGSVQLLTTAGSRSAKAKNAEERGAIEACRSENGCNNAGKEFKTASGGSVGCCMELSSNIAVKSEILQKSDDEKREADLGNQPKDGRLYIYVSLPVDKSENARQSNSLIGSENLHATGHEFSCVLGKRTRESKQGDTVLDSGMEPQSLHAGTPVKQRTEVSKESPEDMVSKVLSTVAKVSETPKEREPGGCLSAVPSAQNYNLTSEVRARNASPCMENLGEEGIRVGHGQSMSTKLLPVTVVAPIVSTSIPNDTGDVVSVDCKRHTTEMEIFPSSSTCKSIKIRQDEAGCSYVTPKISTPTEGSGLRVKVHEDETPLQSSSHLLSSGKSGKLWNSRTLRYSKPRSSDTSANHGSGSDPSSAYGKSDPNAGSITLGEEIVRSDGEKLDRQPESPNATETSRTSGRLEKQDALLVCELGNPGGLSLDRDMIRADTQGDIVREHQPSAVASVVQQSMLPAEIDSPGRPSDFQTTHSALVSRLDGRELSEFKKITNMKGLAQRESEAGDQICNPGDLPSFESMRPTSGAYNEGKAHSSFLSRKERMPLKMEPISLKLEVMPRKTEPVPRRAGAAEAARDRALEDWLYGRNRGSAVACTSITSLSDCSGPVCEPELEINIPIKEEELEICLPIQEDKELHVGSQSHTRRFCGSSETH